MDIRGRNLDCPAAHTSPFFPKPTQWRAEIVRTRGHQQPGGNDRPPGDRKHLPEQSNTASSCTPSSTRGTPPSHEAARQPPQSHSLGQDPRWGTVFLLFFLFLFQQACFSSGGSGSWGLCFWPEERLAAHHGRFLCQHQPRTRAQPTTSQKGQLLSQENRWCSPPFIFQVRRPKERRRRRGSRLGKQP